MFGIKFIKFQPNMYVLKYKKGKIVNEGNGLSFFYYAPTTSLVGVPLSSIDTPFIFEEITQDFQTVVIQGQVSFKIKDPKKIAQFLNYTLDNTGNRYMSDDPEKLPQRIVNLVKVLLKKEIEVFSLKEILTGTEKLAKKLNNDIRVEAEIEALGLEVLGLSILSIKPTKETERALEAKIREAILNESDDAIYKRRNAAVEQERKIKENELNTEIAVENKKKQILESQMDAKKLKQEKEQQLKQDEMNFDIDLENKRKALVELEVENSKAEADAKAYSMDSMMQVFGKMDKEKLQALSMVGMNPENFIAFAFQGLAEKADKIGQLNITPDLLKELIQTGK